MMIEINGIETKVVSTEIVQWLADVVLPKYQGHPWYKVAEKAIEHLASNPVRCEHDGSGRFSVVIVSSRDADIEYYADPDVCNCPGNAGHGRCYHRAVALFLGYVRRYEVRKAAHMAELARRSITPTTIQNDTRFVARYDGALVGVYPCYEDAETGIDAYVKASAWLAQAELNQSGQRKAA